MKKIGLALVLVSLLSGDEIERINALVKEVESMRVGYEKCEEQLKLCQTSSKSSTNIVKKEECSSKLAELRSKDEKEFEKLRKQIENLKNQINKYENTLKTKSKEIEKLKTAIEKLKEKSKKAKEKKVKNQKALSKECVAPKKTVVVVKEEKTQHLALDPKNRVEIRENYSVTITEPKTFRTLNEAEIYDRPEGNVVQKWEKGRSFTSYMESGEWVKITGYFVDKKWTEAEKELWIKRSDAFERK